MSKQDIGILERLAAAGLEKCCLKISKVSGKGWRLSDIGISSGTLEEALGRCDLEARSSVVYIHVEGRLPFTSLMFFPPGDVAHVTRCFLVDLPVEAGGIVRFEEVILLELGNIVLNALINHLQNALKKSAIPSVPMLLKGDSASISRGLGVHVDPSKQYRIITAAVSVQSQERVSGGTVLAVIPGEMSAELERL
jgi:hypothetical protein